MQPIKISLRDCAVFEDSIYFHPTQSIQCSHPYNEDKKDISDGTYQRCKRNNAKWKLGNGFLSSSNTIAETASESSALRHTGSSAGVNTSPLIGALVVVLHSLRLLRLLLLDVLGLTLSLLVELLVLGFDFRFTMLRFTAAPAGPARLLVLRYSQCVR